MNQSRNLIPPSDLIQVLIQLDHPTFNILVNHLKNLKELRGDSDKLSRFLRLRRLDSAGASKEFAALINSSSLVKELFIEALFENASELILPELFLIKTKEPLTDLREIDYSDYIDPEVENSLSESYIYSSFVEEEEIRSPIPDIKEQLIQSTRPNYLPLDQLIQKFNILEPEEIEDIWRKLAESKLILPQLYQELLNKLIINKNSSVRVFLLQVNQNERLLRKMADLLWDRGVNIYSPEKLTHLEKNSSNSSATVSQLPPIPSEYLKRPNQIKPISHNFPPQILNNGYTDRSIIQSWIILKQNISIKDREMIGNWIGLSEEQLHVFKGRTGSVSSVLPDRIHIIRAIDVLKTKYNRPVWLVELARKMGIRLGYPPSQTKPNSVGKSYKLSPIKIDF